MEPKQQRIYTFCLEHEVLAPSYEQAWCLNLWHSRPNNQSATASAYRWLCWLCTLNNLNTGAARVFILVSWRCFVLFYIKYISSLTLCLFLIHEDLFVSFSVQSDTASYSLGCSLEHRRWRAPGALQNRRLHVCGGHRLLNERSQM